ncbi:MAG: CBU_0592 family membrane protein [Rhodovulum sp.]
MEYEVAFSVTADTLCRAVGLLGFALYVAGFYCLSVGRIDTHRPLYFGLVLAASTCVMVSMVADFNLSAALIQGFYMLMSLGAICLRWRAWTSNVLPANASRPGADASHGSRVGIAYQPAMEPQFASSLPNR